MCCVYRHAGDVVNSFELMFVQDTLTYFFLQLVYSQRLNAALFICWTIRNIRNGNPQGHRNGNPQGHRNGNPQGHRNGNPQGHRNGNTQ